MATFITMASLRGCILQFTVKIVSYLNMNLVFLPPQSYERKSCLVKEQKLVVSLKVEQNRKKAVGF